jgi:cytochrome oxidase assembly protein ShyY1
VFRFLFTRRWLALLLAVAIVAFGCIELGLWQFRRYADRNSANGEITANLAAAPVPVSDVMATTTPPASADEWRVVTARGTYDGAHQLAVLYRTRNGAPGVDLVVPLRTSAGPALVVDRGWVATRGGIDAPATLPPPPRGIVTVTGWVRRDADGGSDQTTPHGGFVRAISSRAISASVPYPLYDGFLESTREQPESKPAPATAIAPDLSSGPHFFYGLQWFFFAILAIGFFVYFAWTERQRTLQLAPAVPSQRARQSPVDRQHRTGDVPSGR